MLKLRASFSDKLNTKYSIFVSFSYNPSYVELMKQIRNRSFNSNTKEWEIGWDCYSELIGRLNQFNIPYNGQEFMQSIEDLKNTLKAMEEAKNQMAKIDSSILDDVEFKTTPFPYQKDGIAYGLNTDRFLLADDQGLGKSLQASNIARLKKAGQHCLVICGYDSLQFNWIREIETHTTEKAMVLGQRTKKNGRVYLGSLKDRLEDLQNLDKIEEFFVIMSATTLRQCEKQEYINRKGNKAYNKIFYMADLIEDWCRKGVIGRIIIDEFQVFKNFDSLQSQALLKTKSCPYKIAATGTPLMNKNIDLFTLFTWLGYERKNYWEFRERYCKLGGFKGKEIIGDKNTGELHQRLSQFMLRRKKEDVLDLPEKIFIDEVLEMDGKQWALYEKMQKLTKSQLAQMKGNKALLLSATLNLRKITCHPGWVDETCKDSVKYERARQIVHEAFENKRKTIIFSCFTTPFDSNLECVNLYNMLKPYNPAMIIGDTKDRMAEVDKFQNDDSCYVIVGSIGAMGTGLTLNKASNVIFLDEPWNRALKDQATDRCFVENTKISTPTGFKFIQDIKIGDLVYSGTGDIVTVTDAWKHKNNEKELYKITVWGSVKNPVICTGDHKFLVDGKWIEAKNLEKGNVLSYFTNQASDIDYLTPLEIPKELIVDDYFYNNWGKLQRKGSLKHAKPIDITDEFLYICGFYLGDGFSSGNDFGFYGNTTTKANALNICSKWITDQGLHCGWQGMKNGPKVKQCHTRNLEYARWFRYLFGKNCWEKHFPDFFYKLSKRQLQIVLEGLCDSDGYFDKNQKTFLSYCTQSEALVTNVLWLLQKLGYRPGYYKCKDNKTYYVTCDITHQKKYRIRGNKIKAIEKISSENHEYLYDITVEGNHTFMVNNYVVHNCHRIGTKNNVNIYTLICKGTIDESVHKTVLKKGVLADQVIDGATITAEELEDILNGNI